MESRSRCQDADEISDAAAALFGIFGVVLRGGDEAAVQSDPAQVAGGDKGGHGVHGDGRVVPLPEAGRRRFFRTSVEL